MQFGNPQFLWALPAAALPIALHLFFRRRKSKVDFSTIQFFRVRERFLAHRRRIREWLLLALRTLALLLLILGLARPLTSGIMFAGGGRTDCVIVLDDSMSMERPLPDAGTAFDLAKRKASEVIKTLGEGDAAAVLFTSGREGVLLTRKLQEVDRTIEDSFVTGTSGSFGAALRSADEQFAKSSSPNRELYLFSDFQRQQLPGARISMLHSETVRMYFMKIGGRTANLSIESIKTSSKPKVAGQPVTLSCAIANTDGIERGTDVVLRVMENDEKTDYVMVPPEGALNRLMSFVPPSPGMVIGSLRIDDDSIRMDNRALFAVRVVDELSVSLLETDVLGRVDSFKYLEQALCPPMQPDLNGIRIERALVQELRDETLTGIHVAVLADPSQLTSEATAVLSRFLRSGGSLVCFAGTRTIPGTLSGLGLPGGGGVVGKKASVEERGLKLLGPMAGLGDLLELELINWRRLNRLEPTPEWQIWGKVGTSPIIAACEVGAGKVVVAGFSVRRDYGNWPELKSFPVAMVHLLNAVARDIGSPPRIECGRRLRIEPANDQEKVTIAATDGTQAALTPGPAGEYVFTETWRPGILRCQGGRPQVVIVIPSKAESDVAEVSGEQAARHLVESQVSQVDTASPLATQVRRYRRGSDLAGHCLFLAGFFLAIESVVAYNYRPTSNRE